MSNVLSEEKRQQVIALGRLGWSLRRIQQTGVRRETAGAYLKLAGIPVRPPGGWGRQSPAKAANEVTTGSGVSATAINPNPENPSPKGKAKTKPAIEVTTGSGVACGGGEAGSQRVPSGSTCEPFREAIELGLSRGRNAMAIWQDLVAEQGFPGAYQTLCRYFAVKRFVRKLRGNRPPQEHDQARAATQATEGFLVHRTALRLQPRVMTNSRVRRYRPVCGSRTIGPWP
jgi:hypothetical protein